MRLLTATALTGALFLLTSAPAGAQRGGPVPVRWQTAAGGSATDVAYHLQNLPGNLVMAAGATRSNDGLLQHREGLDFDAWLVKLNLDGDVLWHRTYGGSDHDMAKVVRVLPDGGFVFAGYTQSPGLTHGGRDIYVVRTDALGEIKWQKAFGGPGNDEAKVLIVLPDGNFLVAGETGSLGGDVKRNKGGIDAWVLKLDPNGNLLWDRTYGSPGNEAIQAAVALPDGKLVFVATADQSGVEVPNLHGKVDVWAFQTQADGSIVWSAAYGGSGNDEAHSITQGLNGKLYIAGTTFSLDGDVKGALGEGDFWVMQIETTGKLTWSKNYGGRGDEGANGIAATKDGHLLVTGMARSRDGLRTEFKGVFDGWLLKLDQQGGVVWQKSMGTFQNDEFFSVLEAPEGQYIVAGQAGGNDVDLLEVTTYGGNDLWVACATDPIDPSKPKPVVTPPPTVLLGYVSDKGTGKTLDAEITLMDQATHNPIRGVKMKAGGDPYQFLLTRYNDLAVAAVARGYMLYSQPLRFAPDQLGTQIRLDIELSPIAKDSSINLYDLYFDEGKSALKAASTQSLNLLLLFLQENPSLRVGIYGHTDGVGTGDAELQLSRYRAEAVKSWLQLHGINPTRLEAKGFGGTTPIADPSTEEGRLLNRRVEIRIL